MTKRERQQIARALDLLMADDPVFDEALAILGPMCGRRYAQAELRKMELRNVSLAEVACRPNSNFKVARIRGEQA